MGLKIRSGDTVQVVSGKDAGKQGRVLRVEPKRNRLYVEGLNIVKRHQRPRSLKDTQRGGKVGGVIEKEGRSEEHTSELQSRSDLVCRLLLEKKKKTK